MPFVIGLDIGGTHFRLSTVDEWGHHDRIEKFSSESRLGPQNMIDRLAEHIFDTVRGEDRGPIVGIGIGIAGAIDHINGIVRFSPNLPGWDYVPLAEILSKKLGLPVFVDNDVNLIALGEKWLGAGRDYENFLCMTLGTGVGGGLILNHKIWHGCGTAGEIGHMTIDPDGALCNCGNNGCLETLASATALLRMAFEGFREGRTGLLAQKISADPGSLSASLIAEMAEKGDIWARQLFEKLGESLGIAIANVMNLLCLDAIIIGGGISDAWHLFIKALKAEYGRRVMPGTKPEVPTIPWRLKDAAGIIGAAAAVFQQNATDCNRSAF
ncbi:MAG: ROK family protein [Pseudomonadota bacterium]